MREMERASLQSFNPYWGARDPTDVRGVCCADGHAGDVRCACLPKMELGKGSER